MLINNKIMIKEDIMNNNTKMYNVIGMLFLFDMKDSTKTVHESDKVEQNIYYNTIKATVDSIITNIGDKVLSIKSVGDGYYIYSEKPDDSLLLYMELTKAVSAFVYKNTKLQIRCGASFGPITLIGDLPTELQGDLANITSRCCSNVDIGELVITDTLYNMIRSSTSISHFNLETIQLEKSNCKGCKDIKMWSIKKKVFDKFMGNFEIDKENKMDREDKLGLSRPFILGVNLLYLGQKIESMLDIKFFRVKGGKLAFDYHTEEIDINYSETESLLTISEKFKVGGKDNNSLIQGLEWINNELYYLDINHQIQQEITEFIKYLNLNYIESINSPTYINYNDTQILYKKLSKWREEILNSLKNEFYEPRKL